MRSGIIKVIAGALLPLVMFNPITSYVYRTLLFGDSSSLQKHDVSYVMFDYDEPMAIHKASHKSYLASIKEKKAPPHQGKFEYSRPEPAYLGWNTTVDENETEFDEYTVYLSKNKDMKNAEKYTTTDSEIKIYNVFIGETYYWYVEGEYDGDIYKSEVSSFKTEPEAPRNLYIDGVTNARDMGGWDCDGGKVKQGMIYRTARLHNDEETNITDDGVKTMLDKLGVKTEIDLRYDVTPRENGVLGEKVKYIVLPMDFSDDMMLDEVQAGYIRDFFKILADKNNYPVFFHCSIGTDRTGVCAFLLNGLLGVCEDDLYRDYGFSNFGFIGGERDGHNITHYIELLDKYKGDTLKDRIAEYLISIGVTEGEISSIRKIMIGTK